MQPTTIRPVSKFQMTHLQFARQIRKPPFISCKQLVMGAFVANEPTAFEQLVNDGSGELATTLRWIESFGVQSLGDLRRRMPRLAQLDYDA